MTGITKKKVSGDGGHLVGIAAQALLLSGWLANAHAADPPMTVKAGAEETDVEVFHGARPVTAPSENYYPARERERGREGWVLLNMMISPKGKPYEITVLDSTGNAAIDKAAVRALDDMSFEPAKHGRIPIDSSLTFKMIFLPRNSPAQGASRAFVDAYAKFAKAVDAGDKPQADAELAKLDVQNLYEDAFRSYGKYRYDRQWGTEAEQLADLRHAVAGENLWRYLPKELFNNALAAQLALQVKSQDYGSALNTWKTLEPIVPKSIHQELQRMIDQILALRNTDQRVSTAARIDNSTSWNGSLFKNRFALSVASGAISEIKLRCKKQYLFFKYAPDVQYTVSPSAGDCFIEVVGDPGTMFELVQS